MALYREEGSLLVPVGQGTQFGYNAVADKGRRQSPRTRLQPEFAQLSTRNRGSLDATVQDLPRNFELAAWMVRMHVNYVSQFDPYVSTGNDAVNRELEALLEWHGHKNVFDVAQRHSRSEAMRLFEIAKVFSGDCAFLKANTGALQGIPGRRIAKPTESKSKATKKWRNLEKRVNDRGLIIDKTTGGVSKAALCRWSDDGRTLIFERMVNWPSLIYDGYFTDFDQDRGVSPIASAVNRTVDVMESLEWTNLKIKMHALFGFKFTREGETSPFEPPNDEDLKGATSTAQPSRQIALEKNLMMLDLDVGEDADTIESKTPATEFVDYTGLSIRIILLALDMPYTFFDSHRSSFSARTADANQYEFLARSKQEKNQRVLKEYSNWKVAEWLHSPGEAFLPLQKLVMEAGLTDMQVMRAVSWSPRETPWIDKLKQLEAYEKEVALLLNSRTRILKTRGGVRFTDIAKEVGEEERIGREAGATMPIGKPGQPVTNDTNKDGTDGQ